MSSSEVIDSIYMGLVWFIFLSLLWTIIFNYVKSLKSKMFLTVFGGVLVILSIISAIRVADPSLSSVGSFGDRYSGIGSLLAHILFAIYSFYTAFSASPFNTNQRFVLVTPNAPKQAGGKRKC